MLYFLSALDFLLNLLVLQLLLLQLIQSWNDNISQEFVGRVYNI
jgi:hypothetical protein